MSALNVQRRKRANMQTRKQHDDNDLFTPDEITLAEIQSDTFLTDAKNVKVQIWKHAIIKICKRANMRTCKRANTRNVQTFIPSTSIRAYVDIMEHSRKAVDPEIRNPRRFRFIFVFRRPCRKTKRSFACLSQGLPICHP
jgi:hypothetical protein